MAELFRDSESALSDSKKATSRYWTAFLREVDGAQDPFGIFSDNVQGCACADGLGDPTDEMYYTKGRCYRKVGQPMAFTDADANCKNVPNGHLVYGRTDDEIDGYSTFFQRLFAPFVNVIIAVI